jgi:predicted aldo/keto reductase-like oxidoreductase
MSATRREFLTTAASVAAAAGALALSSRLAWAQQQAQTEVRALAAIPELKTPESTREGDMLFRKLGKAGEKVSLIGLGGYHFATLRNPADSIKLLRRAVDAGINFMDNCWDYHDGEAEIRMGNALKDGGGGGYRQKVFLMSKIDGQTKAAAEKQINESLQRLQVDTIDLMQIHEVVRWPDPDRAFARGGSIEALLAAKQAGKIRYIGFTGHKDPGMHIKMLDVARQNNFTFDSSQFPLNPMDAHYKSFAKDLVPRLVKEGVAVLGMKPLAGGAIVRTNTVTPIQCLHYAMNLPTSVVITGIDSERFLDQSLEAVKTFKPFTTQELTDLLAKTKTLGESGAQEAFKTTTMYDGTVRNPQWLGV